MEDILTSNVFGLLRYVQLQEGLMKYLSFAEDRDGNRLLKYLNSLVEVPQDSIEYQFWPWWEEPKCNGCEPDVVIKLKIPDEKDLLILIEAKYLSGKSSEADESDDKPNDQLAREWDNLIVRAGKMDKRPILIYLTAHYAYPYQDIDDAINEFLDKRPGGAEPVIHWLSWRHLYKVCKNTCDPILKDLALILERLNLRFFDAIKLEYVHIPWSFEKDFDWQKYTLIEAVKWRFET